ISSTPLQHRRQSGGRRLSIDLPLHHRLCLWTDSKTITLFLKSLRIPAVLMPANELLLSMQLRLSNVSLGTKTTATHRTDGNRIRSSLRTLVCMIPAALALCIQSVTAAETEELADPYEFNRLLEMAGVNVLEQTGPTFTFTKVAFP